MSKRRNSRPIKPTVRNGGIRVVARTVRRGEPDISRLMQATLNHYISLSADPASMNDTLRPSATQQSANQQVGSPAPQPARRDDDEVA